MIPGVLNQQGVPFVATALNPADMGANLSLSNGDLTVTKTAGVAYSAVRALTGLSSGKYYWELSATLLSGGDRLATFGVATSSHVLDNYIGINSEGRGYFAQNGAIYPGGAAYGGGALGDGVILGCALDMDNGRIYWSVAGEWRNFGDPETGTNPAFSDLSGLTVYPAVSLYDGTLPHSATINFGASPFTYSAPAGYTAGVPL